MTRGQAGRDGSATSGVGPGSRISGARDEADQ